MKLRNISVLLLLLVAVGCMKDDTRSEVVLVGSAVQFNVSSVDGILWDTPLTRGGMPEVDTVQLDSIYFMTAECGDIQSYPPADSIPLTRGTPVANAKELKNMGIAIFNSEELDFTGATPLWKNIQATNNGGSWQNSQPIKQATYRSSTISPYGGYNERNKLAKYLSDELSTSFKKLVNIYRIEEAKELWGNIMYSAHWLNCSHSGIQQQSCVQHS